MLSDQPRLSHVTSTALLCRWGRQPLEDMTSLETDFETHAIWKGYVEDPAAKDFVARKAHTIALSKARGSCHRTRSDNQPYSRVWKSRGDSLPKLYCVDLVEAYVTQESASLRILCEKRYDLRSPDGRSHDKPLARKGNISWPAFEFIYTLF
jgi:hypothetical protein